MLSYVHPDDLRTHWEYVRKGCKRIHDRVDERWEVEDLWMLLKNQNAALYMILNPELTGFVVLQLTTMYDVKEMNVFYAYSEDGRVMDYAFPEVKDLARSLGAKRLTFMSQRRGWEKRAIELGYKVAHTVYEAEL